MNQLNVFKTVSVLLVAVFAVFVSSVAGETSERRSGQRNIREKLETIIIPRIDFEEATIHQVISFLREKSREHDPDGEGINIILHLREREAGNTGAEDKQLTLTLTEIPLGEIIRLVCFVTELKFYIEPNAVIITDRELPEGELITRFYPVKSGIFEPVKSRDDDRDPWFTDPGTRRR